MGIFDYEQYVEERQEIELKALIALAEFGRENQKYKALHKLEAIAYRTIEDELSDRLPNVWQTHKERIFCF